MHVALPSLVTKIFAYVPGFCKKQSGICVKYNVLLHQQNDKKKKTKQVSKSIYVYINNTKNPIALTRHIH